MEGGGRPRWSRDGRELFYSAVPHTVMVVPVTTGPRFKAGHPRALFNRDRDFLWDVAPDGQSLVIAEDAEAEPVRLQIVVIPDWFEELKAKVGR